VPVHPGISNVGREDALRLAVQGGEDYELLAAMPPSFSGRQAVVLTGRTGIALTRIGTVAEGEGAHLVLDGEPVSLTGFSHFR
jgi:thiamine-monophosphate kinase